MWPVMNDLGLRGLHADALFASGLQPAEDPGVAQVRLAITAAIRGQAGMTARWTTAW
jgi:hypothetical protein